MFTLGQLFESYKTFLRISPWPINNNRIYTEWRIDDPDPFKSYYYKI